MPRRVEIRDENGDLPGGHLYRAGDLQRRQHQASGRVQDEIDQAVCLQQPRKVLRRPNGIVLRHASSPIVAVEGPTTVTPRGDRFPAYCCCGKRAIRVASTLDQYAPVGPSFA
jgi:hypothetical protein